LGFPECVQGDLTRRAVISASVWLVFSWARQGFKSSSPELNLKE